jgi:SAM-dependent methyltransferase
VSENILNEQLKAWEKKSCLRFLYKQWFELIISELTSGMTLEVGAGIGQFKEYIQEAITLDIEKTSWSDVTGDAQYLPVKSDCLGNLVLFDVLHHIPSPKQFFTEAMRALKPGGRILIMDPYISPFSYLVYQYFHPEGVDTECDPLGVKQVCSYVPFDSNQAVATILFFKKQDIFKKIFPELKILKSQRLALLAYPLTGGFGGKQLLPDRLIKLISSLETKFKFISPLLAFRTFIVLEKHV